MKTTKLLILCLFISACGTPKEQAISQHPVADQYQNANLNDFLNALNNYYKPDLSAFKICQLDIEFCKNYTQMEKYIKEL
jgi:hypothetical protein